MSHKCYLALLLALPAGAVAQPLTDPGPAWAGIADTTSFRIRLQRHLAVADGALADLRNASGPRTIANTVAPLLRAEWHVDAAEALASLGLNAHPNAGFRAVAQDWQRRARGRKAAIDVDREIYEALAAVDTAGADPAIQHVIGWTLAAYRRDGVDLDPSVRERAVALRTQIASLGSRFERNIYDDVRTIRVAYSALAGMPADFLAAFGPVEPEGLVTIELTRPRISTLLTYAESDSLREVVYRARFSAGHPQNVQVLDSLRTLRHELAGLLGYPNWAAYSMAPMMAGSPDRVRGFLADVDEASADAAGHEITALAGAGTGESGAAPDAWSLQYLQRLHRQNAYDFDEQAVRAYLPYDRVRDGVLAAFQRMFALEFRASPHTPVWSPDVEPYDVWEEGQRVGRFYLDAHPRDGKFGHFAVFPVRLGAGELPEGVLIGNWPGGDESDPGLLSPGEVSTFFHEFGHLMHVTFLGRSRHVSPTVSDDLEWDFIEAPSNLLEEWARDPGVLASLARHHETGEPLPPELIAAFRRADAFGRAASARFSLSLAALALDLYDDPPAADATIEAARRAAAYLPVPWPEDLTQTSSFLHLNEYSSNYYTYLWSAVIARDLLTGFNRHDLLDPEAGVRYRDAILARTGIRPAAALVEDFLGRPFNADAWRAWLAGE